MFTNTQFLVMRFDFIIDSNAPTLQITGGHLVRIDSDKLGEVRVQVTISDDYNLNLEPINMHWFFIRQGTNN